MGGETPARGPPSASRGPVCPRGCPGHARPRHPRGMMSARAGQLVFAARPHCVNTDKTFRWTLQMSKCLLFRALCQYLLGIGSAGTRQRCGVPGSREAGDPNPVSARRPGKLRGAAWVLEPRVGGREPGDGSRSVNTVTFSFSCSQGLRPPLIRVCLTPSRSRAVENRPQWLSLTLGAKEEDEPYGDSVNPEEKEKITCRQLNACWLQRPAGVSGAPTPPASGRPVNKGNRLRKEAFLWNSVPRL